MLKELIEFLVLYNAPYRYIYTYILFLFIFPRPIFIIELLKSENEV